MDTPAHLEDYEELSTDMELLDSMGTSSQRSDLSDDEALDGIQSRLDSARSIALLRSIPELVRAPSQMQAPGRPPSGTPPPGTREPFFEALSEIQQMIDDIRANRVVFQPDEEDPSGRIPLGPVGVPDLLNIPGEPPAGDKPVQSQDEMVIRQRGRRCLPETWSPDKPPKITTGRLASPKAAVKFRTARRKRLRFW